jgi:hypothetical protein
MHTIKTLITATCGALILGLAAESASAADLRLRCETRATPARSKISVDGNNLVPQNAVYSAQVTSGGATVSHPPVTAVGDEAEFDFDSNPRDVAAGARAIPANFIKGGSVTAVILDANGNTAAGPATATCRSR